MFNQSHVSYNNMPNEQEVKSTDPKINIPPQPYDFTNQPIPTPTQIAPLEQSTGLDNENPLLRNLSPERQFLFFKKTVCIWICWQIAMIFLTLFFYTSELLKSLTSSSSNEWHLYPTFYILLAFTTFLLTFGVKSEQLRNPPLPTFILFLAIFMLALIYASFASSFRSLGIFPEQPLALYIIIFIQVFSLLSLMLVQVSSCFQTTLDIQKYLQISTIAALVLAFINFSMALSLHIYQLAFIFGMFPLYGFLLMRSAEQILKGKFQLKEKETSLGAMALYLNFFTQCCGNN